MSARLILCFCLVCCIPLSVLADAEDDVEKAADRWVKDEIGRDPLVADSLLDSVKDFFVGRQVSPVMGGILGRVNEALAQAEGTYGKPNKNRGLCGSAAVRQASGIAADAKHSRMFRSFAGTLQDALGAAVGIPVNAAKWATIEGAKELEKSVGELIAKQQPEDYMLSKSQEGCSIEMRVVWNKANSTYKFTIMGDCGCNNVRCWNFDTREVPLGRWSVSGDGKVTPEVKVKNGDAEIYFDVSRINGSSLVVNANCCDAGEFGSMDSWVDMPPQSGNNAVGGVPLQPAPQPKLPKRPEPGSGSAGGASLNGDTSKFVSDKPKNRVTKGKPKPKPKALALKCPKYDPIRKEIIGTETEKTNAGRDKADAEAAHKKKNSERDSLAAEVNKMEAGLKVEGGVGAESTDKKTGIKTTSYDDGKGQVEIKSFDKDGNKIGETKFRARPSTAERRKKLLAEKRKLKAVDEALGQLSHAVYQATNRIEKANEQLSSLRGQLAECIQKCKAEVEEPAKRMVSLGDDWVEQVERTVGLDLTDLEIKNYEENPEEVLRLLGEDGVDTEMEPSKPKTSLPRKAPKPQSRLGDDMEFELESARSSSGTNAFDANTVEDFQVVPSGGQVTATGTTPTTDTYKFVPAPVTDTQPEIKFTVPGEDEPIEVLPPPTKPLQVSVNGSIKATHIVRTSPCPQNAGNVRIENQTGGNPIEIVGVTVSGKVKPKLAVTFSGNVVTAQFNCSSPVNGTFSGQVNITVRDSVTGETKVVSALASITVQGLQK